jgi:hypothetical protein
MLKKKSSYGAFGLSTGCAYFLEDVKMHLVMQRLNAGSQENKTWEVGLNRRMLDAVKEKGLHMNPSGPLQGMPTSWRI